MELIILPLLEVAITLAVAMASLAANLIVLIGNLAVLIFECIGAVLGFGIAASSSGSKGNLSQEQITARRKKLRRWGLRILAGASGLLFIILSSIAVANSFYFEPLSRWMFGHLEKRAGISMTFDKAEGSLWSGDFRFKNLRAVRTAHVQSIFDIKVEYAAVDISMSDLIWQNIVIDSLKVEGVEGFHKQLAKGDKKLKPRRSFEINNINLGGINLNYENLTLAEPLEAAFELNILQAESVASRTFVADLLFKSNASGSFNGVKFNISNDKGPNKSYTSSWRSDDLPVAGLASSIGGPFNWFESGRVDIKVDNQSGGARKGTEMNWSLVFRDFEAKAPADASPAVKLWAVPLVAYLNGKNDRLDLGFKFKLSEEDMEFASTDDLRGLILKMVGENFREKMAEAGKKLREDSLKSLDAINSGKWKSKPAAGDRQTVSDSEENKDEKKGGLRSILKKRPDKAAAPES